MSARVDFYFDFMSPYGYLGSLGIARLAAQHGWSVDWRPMLLGVSVMRVMGLPPMADIPLKGPYTGRDFERCLRFEGVPCHPAGLMNPLPAGRAFTWLRERDADLAVRFAQRVYRAHWSEGRSMSTPVALGAEAGALDLEPEELVAAIEDPGVKALHRRHVDASIDRGVFGSPTFAVGEELFWGHDRLPHLERWLVEGPY